jgi:hypothetical protein
MVLVAARFVLSTLVTFFGKDVHQDKRGSHGATLSGRGALGERLAVWGTHVTFGGNLQEVGALAAALGLPELLGLGGVDGDLLRDPSRL